MDFDHSTSDFEQVVLHQQIDAMSRLLIAGGSLFVGS
jgi:hypothetical protein